MRYAIGIIGAALAFAIGTGCRAEQKDVRGLPTGGATAYGVRQSDLQPGPVTSASRKLNPFDGNTYAISEGKRLYNHYNCSGCHANGGGAIGPALMDDEWIYGSSGEAIFSVIVEGRPQGMPAFEGRVVDQQVWQIVAYVRSLSNLDKETDADDVTPETQQGREAEVQRK